MKRAIDILAEYDVDLDDLVETGFLLYVGSEEEDVGAKKREFREFLLKTLEDLNVSLLVAAASHLDDLAEHAEDGSHPFSGDPESLVADELIGMSIAEYIAGKKGLFNYVRYDREKPGKIGVLPPFMDDVVGALVAACMTRIFE